MSHKSVTLFVPDLLGLFKELKHLPEHAIPKLKSLQRFLSRAGKKSVDIHDWHTGLTCLFEFEKLPAAALFYKQFAKTDAKNIFYLCADPVYIQPDLNNAVLLAHEKLDLSLDDAGELAVAINAHFVDEDWSLDVLTPHRWVLKLIQQPAITTTPLAQLRQRTISDKFPQGQDSRYWQRIQNEIQMLLFAHPLNPQREAQGKLPVNSLWLWGEGSLPEKISVNWQRIIGQGELLDALASWSSTDRETISIHDKLVLDKPSGKILLASNEFISVVQEHDFHAWTNMLEQFEANWIEGLLRSLKTGQLDSIILFSGNGMQFSLNRKNLKRWWQRIKPINYP